MCFHTKQSKKAKELKVRFNAEFEHEEEYNPNVFNGFTFPKTPVIANTKTNTIRMFHWGLLPQWTRDINFRKNTLNARIETLNEKASFKNYTNNRCLVLVDGFFEWQWLDEKGKQKQKYEITLPSNEAFAMAGLWSEWVNFDTGETLNTYSIITTNANEQMAIIHNSKKRMPFILTPEQEIDWLMGSHVTPDMNIELLCTPI